MSILIRRFPDFLKSNPRAFFWLYFIAFGVVVTELLISLMFINYEAGLIENNNRYIQMSGRQSMLSQRILFAAERLQHVDDEELRRALKEDSVEFKQNHLKHFGALPPTITSMSQTNTNNTQQQVDPLTASFVTLAGQAATIGLTESEFAKFRHLVEREILPRVETLMSRLSAESASLTDTLNRTFNQAIIVAIFILCLEAVFIFLPAQSMLIHAYRQIEEKNADLNSQNATINDEKRRLQEAIAEANALRQEQAEFTYAISHDLKSPANTIKMIHGELYELLKDHDDDEVAVFLNLLASTTNRMTGLVEDVLGYTTTLGETPETEVVDLNILIGDLLEDLRGDIKEAKGEIEVSPLPEMKGCPGQLRMLFQNLVSNGLKFQKPGEVSRLKISCTEDSDTQIAVQIQDNGIGIAEEDKAKVFGLFNRLHLREDYPGTGLGLALCRRIVANHAGRISLDSVLGEGSAFTVTFPKGLYS